MCGVSIGSIAMNIIFKSVEHEKMAKHCILILKNKLLSLGVRSRIYILRAIYEQLYHSDVDAVKKVLEDKTAIYYWPVDENDPDLRFSKDLVTLKELTQLQNKANKIKVVEDAEDEEKFHKDEISCCF